MECNTQSDARILVVDDDPVVFLLVKNILKSENYFIVHITDGISALEYTSNNKVDLILLDIIMPGINGFEVCTRLKQNPASSNTPVIFLSAKVTDNDYAIAFEIGAIDFLAKPIKNLDLILKIRNYLKLARNEQKLKESELRYRMLADYNYDWEYWLGPDGRYLYISPSCERITGYSADHFLANPDSIIEITHPDHIDMVRKLYLTFNELMEFTSFEYKIIDHCGQIKWVIHTCNPVFDNNMQWQGIRGNYRDITERKMMENAVIESEKKFRNIFRSSIDGIVITDCRHMILESNESFQRNCGLAGTSQEPLLLLNYIHLGDREEYKSWLKDFHSQADVSRPKEFRLISHSGKVLFMEFNSRVINYRNEQALLSILRDVTERKEMHYKNMNAIMETEEKERRRFARDLHDGMGPLLSTIKLYVRSILTAKNDKFQSIAIEKSLETIDDAILQAKEIAYDISPSILRDFGIVVAVQSYVNKFNEAKNVNINFYCNLKERMKPNIESSLFRIIIELINNTVKHAKAEKAIIKVIRNENELLIEYADDGIGFVLQPMLEYSKGQGLHNIIHRVNSIGGEIAFETEPGEGMSVRISIDINQLNDNTRHEKKKDYYC